MLVILYNKNLNCNDEKRKQLQKHLKAKWANKMIKILLKDTNKFTNG